MPKLKSISTVASAPVHSHNLQFANASGGRGLIALLLLLAVAAIGWWYLAPNTLPASIRVLVPASPKSNPVLYKWRDAKGHWQVSDIAPTDRPFETLHVNPNVNVVPSVVPPPAGATR